MTEAELLAAVLERCEQLGLAVLHIPDSRKLTHGKGWPDLFITGHLVLAAELKDANGRLSREQIRWRYRLQAAGVLFRVWRPADLESGAINFDLEGITECRFGRS